VQVLIRKIAAQCAGCGGDDFEPLAGKRFELSSQTPMRCTGCGAVTIYIELVMQIADKALQRSADVIAQAKRQREANQK
jgi:hypothetical protein